MCACVCVCVCVCVSTMCVCVYYVCVCIYICTCVRAYIDIAVHLRDGRRGTLFVGTHVISFRREYKAYILTSF